MSPIENDSNKMKLIQSPFFDDMVAAMLEPESLSKQWFLWRPLSPIRSKSTSMQLESRLHEICQMFQTLDARPPTFTKASDWPAYDLNNLLYRKYIMSIYKNISKKVIGARFLTNKRTELLLFMYLKRSMGYWLLGTNGYFFNGMRGGRGPSVQIHSMASILF